MCKQNEQTGHIAEILKNDLGVKENYQHGPKRVMPGEPIEANSAMLKWYALFEVMSCNSVSKRANPREQSL